MTTRAEAEQLIRDEVALVVRRALSRVPASRVRTWVDEADRLFERTEALFAETKANIRGYAITVSRISGKSLGFTIENHSASIALDVSNDDPPSLRTHQGKKAAVWDEELATFVPPEGAKFKSTEACILDDALTELLNLNQKQTVG